MSSPSTTRHATIALIGVATVLANLAFGVAWQLALLAGAAVLMFGELMSRRSQSVTTSATSKPDAEGALSVANPLTRREVEIAALVAQGLTNKAIGRQLFISERTVDNHVQHIYNKISVDSRPELALWMRERGLLSESVSRKSQG